MFVSEKKGSEYLAGYAFFPFHYPGRKGEQETEGLNAAQELFKKCKS